MKLSAMMTVVGVGLLGSMATARGESPDTSPPPATRPPPIDVNSPPEATTPPTTPPTTIPDVDEPVSPAAPIQPGVMPPLATPSALPPPAPPVGVEGSMGTTPMWMSRVGTAMMLGGGYEDFTYGNIKSMTGAGGSWDARLVAGTRQFVGLEAAYVGSAHSIQTLGLASNTNLISNGAEGALRVNIPIVRGDGLIEPFGFIGIGWQHYNLSKASNTADLTGSDDVTTMPYGGGLEASFRRLMLDARFTYRQTYNNDLLRASGGKLNTWGVGGNVGVEF